MENGTDRNVVPTFLFDFYTYYRPNLHRMATIHNAADRRQTAERKGRLCYNIGGPNTLKSSDAWPDELVVPPTDASAVMAAHLLLFSTLRCSYDSDWPVH